MALLALTIGISANTFVKVLLGPESLPALAGLKSYRLFTMKSAHIFNIRALIASVGIFLLCPDGRGDTPKDGNELLKQCEAAIQPLNAQTQEEAINSSILIGYINGFIDGLAFDEGLHSSDALPINPPRGTTMGQHLRVIKKWLEDHPSMLNQNAMALIYTSLKEGYHQPPPPLTKADLNTKPEWILFAKDPTAEWYIDRSILAYSKKAGGEDKPTVETKRVAVRQEGRGCWDEVQLTSCGLTSADDSRVAYVIDVEQYDGATKQSRLIATFDYDATGKLLGKFNVEEVGQSKWRPITAGSSSDIIFHAAQKVMATIQQ
jgi:hypothetical protein